MTFRDKYLSVSASSSAFEHEKVVSEFHNADALLRFLLSGGHLDTPRTLTIVAASTNTSKIVLFTEPPLISGNAMEIVRFLSQVHSFAKSRNTNSDYGEMSVKQINRGC